MAARPAMIRTVLGNPSRSRYALLGTEGHMTQRGALSELTIGKRLIRLQQLKGAGGAKELAGVDLQHPPTHTGTHTRADVMLLLLLFHFLSLH